LTKTELYDTRPFYAHNEHGFLESYEETFNSLMESPRATYMGDGWFAIYEKIEEGHTSNREPPT
jgi:hypothetical protein